MRRHRFYTPVDLNEKTLVISDKEQVRQMVDVLKLGPGEEVELFDGKGNTVIGRIDEFGKKKVGVIVDYVVNSKQTTVKKVSLYCAILKRDNFEWVVQKATEVGVSRIVPVITHHTVKTGFNAERLRKIAIEACEQSGRVFIPEIMKPVEFEKAMVGSLQENDITVFCDFAEVVFGTAKVPSGSSVGIFVGPEGGWDEVERTFAKDRGAEVMSLGSTVLRAETAAVVASYVACN